jgi:hypothetical protein
VTEQPSILKRFDTSHTRITQKKTKRMKRITHQAQIRQRIFSTECVVPQAHWIYVRGADNMESDVKNLIQRKYFNHHTQNNVTRTFRDGVPVPTDGVRGTFLPGSQARADVA